NNANGLNISWGQGTSAAGNQTAGLNVNVINAAGGTAGQINGLRVHTTGPGGSINSTTVGIKIDSMVASSSAGNETAIDIGDSWDYGLVIASRSTTGRTPRVGIGTRFPKGAFVL